MGRDKGDDCIRCSDISSHRAVNSVGTRVAPALTSARQAKRKEHIGHLREFPECCTMPRRTITLSICDHRGKPNFTDAHLLVMTGWERVRLRVWAGQLVRP